MTVGAGYTPAVYAGNGSTYQFPFTWPIQSADHLVVTKTVAGVDTVLVRGVDYLLVWIGAGATGTVRTVYYDGGTPINDPPATDETITLDRVVPLNQGVDLRNQGPFLGEVVEQALDKATQIDQQQQVQIDDHEGRIGDLEDRPLGGGGGGGLGVSVLVYGATGDGTTDDSASIQDAIDTCNAAGGGVVFFPAGEYRAKNLLLKTGVTLTGEGNGSLLKLTDDAYYSASPYHMDQLIRTPGGATTTDIGLTNLRLNGNLPTVYGDEYVGCPLFHGVDGTTLQRVLIANVRFEYNGFAGIRIYGIINQLTVRDCTFKDTDACLWFGGRGGSDISISGVIAEGGTSECMMFGMDQFTPPNVYERINISNVLSYQKIALVTFYGPIKRAVVSNCTAWGYVLGTAYHCQSVDQSGTLYSPEMVSFNNCSAYEFGLGAILTGYGISWLGGVLYGMDVDGIKIENCEGATVTGATIISGNRRVGVDGYGIKVVSGARDTVLSSNSIISDDDSTHYAGIGVIGTGKHTVIANNFIDGWESAGITIAGGSSLSITDNYGRRGPSNNFVLCDSTSTIYELRGNRGGKALTGSEDQIGWDITVSTTDGATSLVHRDFAQVSLGTGTSDLATIDATSLFRGRSAVVEMRSEFTLKHLTGNLVCPGGQDMKAHVGDMFVLTGVFNTGEWRWLVQFMGSNTKWDLTRSITSSAATDVLGDSDTVVVVTGTTTHTLTLPAAFNGRRVVIKNRSTGAVSVQRAGSDTIDGGTAAVSLVASDSRTFAANGTDWCIVGGTGTATPASHASSHVGGADPIAAATASNDGLMTAAHVAALGNRSSPAMFYDWNDFIGGANSSSVTSTIYALSASGGGFSYSNGFIANTIGNARLTTNSGATNYSMLYTSGNVFNFSECHVELNLSFRLAVASDGTETYTDRFGLGDSTTGVDPVDGAFFRYTHSVNGGRWQCVTRQNDTETATDSGVSTGIGIATMTKARIVWDGTDVKFYLGGTLVATNTTNIPSGTARSCGIIPGQIVKSAGTTSREMTLDYVEVIITPNTSR
jgi:hypothetical protein